MWPKIKKLLVLGLELGFLLKSMPLLFFNFCLQMHRYFTAFFAPELICCFPSIESQLLQYVRGKITIVW